MITRTILSSSTPVQMAGEPTAPRALIVLQEAFGVNDHIRGLVEQFAEGGYFAVAPELFHRTGSPEVAYDNIPQARESLATLSQDGLHTDLVASGAFLNGLGFATDSIGAVGFCMGGYVAYFAATLGVVGAAVSFYGGGIETGRFGLPSQLELAPSLTCPWLGFFGDLDQSIPVEQVESLRAATDSLEVGTTIIRYAEADHGFNCDGRPAAFNREASTDATQRTWAFFAEHLTET